MTASFKRASPMDLLRMDKTNLDPLTENYDIAFYLTYMQKWPALFQVLEDKTDGLVAYIMGKLEESPPEMRGSEHYTPWHAHITVLTVAPRWRRCGYATRLIKELEHIADNNNAWFVDLYVRVSNKVAIKMYEHLGYSVFRRVVGYYNDGPSGKSEDAFDMRKPLSRDKNREHVRENGENFLVNPEDVS